MEAKQRYKLLTERVSASLVAETAFQTKGRKLVSWIHFPYEERN